MTKANPIGPPVPGWTPRPRPGREAIEGRYVRLEPLSVARHGDDLWAAFDANEPDRSWTYRLQDPFRDPPALKAWLASIESGDDPLYFAYVDRATGRAAGNGGFMSIQPEGGSIEIGSIMIAPPLARARGGTEALSLMIRWCFEAGYRRVEWTCDALNAPSRDAATRLGFSYELTFRDAVVSKARNRDTAVFSIVDGDWPAIRAAHDAWLAPENFAADGAQRTSLSALTRPRLRRPAPPPAEGAPNALGQPLGRPVAGWTPPPPPPRAPMEGRHARLEPLDPARHAAALFAAYTAENAAENAAENTGADETDATTTADAIWDYMPCGPFADFAAYRAWAEAAAADEATVFFAIMDKVRGPDPVGVASYLRINPAHGAVEVGNIAYAPALQRTAAATEAMYLMMKTAFDLGYRRYEWKCNALNAPSRRLAARLGFRFEGEFAQALVVKGRNRDTAWFGLCADHWPRVRAAMETWLAPENFDADGRQRRALSALTALDG